MENFEDFEIISRYTRQQAIEDGVLADVSAQARETGILLPTVITEHVHHVLEAIPQASQGQDYRGRLHDVLWMTFLKLKSFGSRNLSEVEFPAVVKVFIDGKLNELWIVVDGDGLTIMYPEDY
jgi:hypothetical protein